MMRRVVPVSDRLSRKERRCRFCTGVGFACFVLVWAIFVGLAWREERTSHRYYGGKLQNAGTAEEARRDGVSTDAATLIFHITVLLNVCAWAIYLLYESAGPQEEALLRIQAVDLECTLIMTTIFLFMPTWICYGIVAGGGYVLPVTTLQYPLFMTFVSSFVILLCSGVKHCFGSAWIKELWCTDVPVVNVPLGPIHEAGSPRVYSNADVSIRLDLVNQQLEGQPHRLA